LVSLTELLEDLTDEVEMQESVSPCGSFFTLRGKTAYFMHQSAHNFLLEKASDDVSPDGIEAAHQVMFSRSLAISSRTLQQDMHGLEAPGVSVDDIGPLTSDPMAASRYQCINWIDHRCDSRSKSGANSAKDAQVVAVVCEFVEKKYLNWLEGLSLCKTMAKDVTSETKAWLLVKVQFVSMLRLSAALSIDANTARKLRAGESLLSFSKTLADSLCTTKGRSRAILFRDTLPYHYLVKLKAQLEGCFSMKSQEGLLSSPR
jgi:hypothetical protein